MTPPLMNIDDPEPTAAPGIALFNLGFRPFFLLAGITAVLLVPLWIFAYIRGQTEFGYYTAILWHSHEMLFGYTVAVIAGFLLTAVRNWTDLPTPGGKALAGLIMLWLAGRIAPFVAGFLPHGIIAALDIAFLPVLAIALSIPLLRRKQTHNLVFLLILSALTLANVLVHMQLLGMTQATAKPGLNLAVYLVILLIAILGGRVIPFFTERGIAGTTTRQWKAVEYLSLGSLVVLLVIDLAHASQLAIAVFAVLAAAGHGIRLFGWYQKQVWSVPLLWVLHLGYAWLVVGFLFKALSTAGLASPALATHAFTAGGIGTVTLGMMARVALGHTGRALRVGPAMFWAFVLITLAGMIRVFPPAINPGYYDTWLVLAAILWSTAFAIFVSSYAGILIRPRVDGRPG
jgi:uncharacterized protein involved in response to NO